MSARLVLARHGNTFNPGDKAFWVGARSNLPLVAKGLEQARLLGEGLKKTGWAFASIVCGPLQRTRQTAAVAAECLGFDATAIIIDERLKEIDYGAWEGKTNDEIAAQGFADDMASWSKNSVYPANAGWQPAEAQIMADVRAFLADRRDGASLVVTSNGILRFFARAVSNPEAIPNSKVATGHLCLLEGEGDTWRATGWNLPPT